MTYRVLDTSINKLFGAFDNEAAASRLADALIGSNDDGCGEEVSVGCERAGGTHSEPLTGVLHFARIRELSLLGEPVAAGRPEPERSRSRPAFRGVP